MTLKIGENTWISGRLVLPVDVTTVVGNLLDNAVDAARLGGNHIKEVEIELLQEGSTLHVIVADSGDGIAPDFVEDLFTEGRTTKPDSGYRAAGVSGSRCRGRSADPSVATCGCSAQATPTGSFG